MKNKVRGILEDNVPRQLRLEGRAVRFKFIHDGAAIFRAKDADKDVRVLEIRRYLDLVNSHDSGFESDFPSNDSTKLTLYELVYAQQAMFH